MLKLMLLIIPMLIALCTRLFKISLMQVCLLGMAGVCKAIGTNPSATELPRRYTDKQGTHVLSTSMTVFEDRSEYNCLI